MTRSNSPPFIDEAVDLQTAEQVARRAKISERHLRRLRRLRLGPQEVLIPGTRLVRFPRHAVDQWLLGLKDSKS